MTSPYQLSLEFMLDALPHMAWQTTLKGEILFTNVGWRNYTGLDSEKTYVSWRDLVHPDDSKDAFGAWDKCFSDKQPTTHAYRIKRAKDGEYLWHNVCTHYFERNNSIWWVGCSIDDPAVTKNKELYHTVVEASINPIITVDALDGNVITYNQAAQNVFLYSREEIIGKPFTTLMDDSISIPYDMYSSQQHDTLTGRSIQTAIKKKNGVYIPVSISVGHYTESGKQLYVMVLHEPEEKNKLQQELHKSKDSFLKTMSHELRTPLFGLLGIMSMMQAPVNSDSELELKQMEECTRRLLTVVNNMIDFYKLENLFITPLSLPFQPRDLVSEVCANYQSCVPEGVTFTSYVHNNVPPTLIADSNFIKHTLSNIICNALRFTHSGSVTMDVSVDDSMLAEGKFPPQRQQHEHQYCARSELERYFLFESADFAFYSIVESKGTTLSFSCFFCCFFIMHKIHSVEIACIYIFAGHVQLIFAISDTGIGIAPEFFPKMFQPFTQEDSSDSRQYGGVGLGLAVSKHLVDLLGGTIIIYIILRILYLSLFL